MLFSCGCHLDENAPQQGVLRTMESTLQRISLGCDLKPVALSKVQAEALVMGAYVFHKLRRRQGMRIRKAISCRTGVGGVQSMAGVQ